MSDLVKGLGHVYSQWYISSLGKISLHAITLDHMHVIILEMLLNVIEHLKVKFNNSSTRPSSLSVVSKIAIVIVLLHVSILNDLQIKFAKQAYLYSRSRAMESEVALMIFYFPDFEKVERHSRRPTYRHSSVDRQHILSYYSSELKFANFINKCCSAESIFVASSFLCAQDFRPGIYGIS